MNEDINNVQQQGLTPSENAVIMTDLAHYGIEAQENRLARQVLGIQVVVMLTSAGIAYGMKTPPQFAIAVLCGGGVSAVNGALLAWRMARSAQHSVREAHNQLRLLYLYAAERFLVVVALLGLFMLALKLSPLALLGGFVMGQAALIAARLFLSKFKDD